MRTGLVMQQQHPFSEEALSLPANAGTKFRQERAERGRRNGVVMLLEFGEQYTLAIPEHSQHDFFGRWCHLKLLVRQEREMFPLHGCPHRLGHIMVLTRLITSDDPRKYVLPFVLVALPIPFFGFSVVVSAGMPPRGSTLYGSLAAHSSWCKPGHVNNH